METCIICGSKIAEESNLIIMSNKVDHHFYSHNCIKEFVKNPRGYLPPVKSNDNFYLYNNKYKVECKIQLKLK